MIVLVLGSLHKTYAPPALVMARHSNVTPKAKKALAGVSLTLGPGLYGLLGPNGAGKSTLIGIITGTLAADSGEVLWCGRPARGIRFRRVLGYMPQQQGLYDSYTGRRFLAYMAALKELPRKAVPAEVDRVAAAVNLSAELDKRLSAYSGGMKQRLLLASALLGDPKLLILDEPTAGLDPKERVRLRELLAAMAADRIILVATHVVSDVETVATEVILLRAGQIVDSRAGAGPRRQVRPPARGWRMCTSRYLGRGTENEPAHRRTAQGLGQPGVPDAAGRVSGRQLVITLDGHPPHRQPAPRRGLPRRGG